GRAAPVEGDPIVVEPCEWSLGPAADVELSQTTKADPHPDRHRNNVDEQLHHQGGKQEGVWRQSATCRPAEHPRALRRPDGVCLGGGSCGGGGSPVPARAVAGPGPVRVAVGLRDPLHPRAGQLLVACALAAARFALPSASVTVLPLAISANRPFIAVPARVSN